MKILKSETIKARIGLGGPALNRIPGPPPQIPDHEMVRCIGQGSYGEVWLARNAVGTWRAVKVVYRQNFNDSRPYDREFAGIQSYEPVSRTNEGLIDVLQIGRNDAEGYFYYVMELADPAELLEEDPEGGPAVQKQPREQQLRTVRPFDPNSYVPKTLSQEIHQRGRLSYDECITLGLTLNLALGHLHRHGLIHRDVKPSNIIFVNGVPKLTDIGLVTDLAGAESFVGTEGFIPPEGPNSPQADLYALGKVLYEASMGKDRNEFPEPLTQLGLDADSRILMELNAVLVRACAPDPKQRYHRAEEMNADLALLHNGESVRNKHALARRLRLMTQIGVGTIAVLVLAVIPYSVAIREAQKAKALAASEEKQRRIAETQKAVAEAEKARAKTEADKSQAVAGFLKETLIAAKPSVALERDTRLLRELMESTARRLDTKFQDQPEVEAELRLTLAQVYLELGDYIKSEAMYRRALDLYRTLPGDSKSPFSSCLSGLSMVVSAQGRGKEAEKLQLQALEIRNSGTNKLEMAESYQCLGTIFSGENRVSESEDSFRIALKIRERELGHKTLQVAESINGLAGALSSQGRWPEAEDMFREGLSITGELLTEKHPTYLWMLNGLATSLLREKKLQDAESTAHGALILELDVMGPNHPLVATTLTVLGRVLEGEGRKPEAKTNLDQALNIWTERLGNQDPSMGETVSALFDILFSERKYEEARQVFERVSGASLKGKTNKTLISVCGNYLARTGQWTAAAEQFERLVILDPDNHQVYQGLAALYLQLGEVEEYKQFRTRILANFGSVTNDPRIADRMAKSCLMLPLEGDALMAAAKLANVSVALETGSSTNAWFELCKGLAEFRMGHYNEAKQWMRRVEEHRSDGTSRDVEAYMILAMSEAALQNTEAAAKAFEEGTRLAGRRLREVASGDIDTGWTDWILSHSLIQEAKATLANPPHLPATVSP